VSAGSAPPSLTAIVITKNEAHQIAACIAALRFAPKILVVDSGSEDGTREAAVAAGAEVALHPFTDYASQRNFGLSQVTTAWALMIDADERVSPEPGVVRRSSARRRSRGWPRFVCCAVTTSWGAR
jgi:glycosyltransferase involved in cell wall biosynthesis